MVVVVIPTLNEEETIGTLALVIRLSGYKAVVIDGGSTDRTVERALQAKATVLPYKRGYREQMTAGWKFALALGADRIVQMDAGGSHSPDDLWHMLQSDADLVIGSRFMFGSAYLGKPLRALGSRFAAFMLNFARHSHYTDWTSGFRVWKREALEKVTRQVWLTKGHAWQMEVLFEAGEKGLTVGEVPILYEAGRSYMGLRDVFDAIGVWIWVFFAGPARDANGRRYG